MADLALNITARNQAQAVLNSLGSGLGKVAAQAKTAQQQLAALGAGLTSAGTKLTAGVTAPLLGFAAAAIKGAADNEQLAISFTTMLGSADKAKVLMGELAEFAASTPFEQPEIVNAGKQLLAFGVAAGDIQPTLTQLGDLAAGLGIPIGDLSYLYGTAKAQGRLFMADINQFSSRGIPMIEALATTMGVAQTDVRKLVEEGKIGFPQMQAALSYLTGEGSKFGGLMEAQSSSLAGLFSTLKDQVGMSLTAIGEQLVTSFDLKGILQEAIVYLTRIKDGIVNFAKTNPQMFKMALTIGAVAAAIGPLLIGLGMITTWIAAALPALSAVAGAFSFLLGPIGLVVAALGAAFYFDIGGIRGRLAEIGAWFTKLVDVFQTGEFKQLGGLLVALGMGSEQAYELGAAIGGVVRAAQDMGAKVLDAFGNIGGAIRDFFTGDISFDGLTKIMSQGFSDIGAAIGDFFGGAAFGDFLEAIRWSDFIESLTWENFIAVLSDWGAYISVLVWDAWLVVVDWANYISPFLWDAWLTIVDWSTWLVVLAWTDYIAPFLWDAWVTVVDWANYIAPIAWDTIVTTLTDWGAWITALDWTTIITTVIDWATWIPALTWAGFITAIDWGVYVASLAWDGFVSVLDWLTVAGDGITWTDFISALDWATYIVTFTWDSFIDKLEWTGSIAKLESWRDYITAIDWTSFITAVVSWADYIAKLDWTAGVITVLDWATWIPALAWNGLIAVIDWAVYLDTLDWSTTVTSMSDWGVYITSLDWAGYITSALSWASYVTTITWGNFVSKLNWPDSVSNLTWDSYLEKIGWTSFVSTMSDWSTYISALSWADFVTALASWSTWVSTLSWTSFVTGVRLADYIPTFPGWASLINILPKGFGGFGAGNNANGTDNWKGGWTWVGEKGPELVNLPKGAQVLSNGDSMGMIGQLAAGTTSLGDAMQNVSPIWRKSERGGGQLTAGELIPRLRETVMAQVVRPIEDASKTLTKGIKDGAKELEDAMRSAARNTPGLFSTSEVTQEQLDLAKLGVPQNFADDWIRHLTDEVVNGVEWADADIKDAAQRAGIDPGLPAKVILDMVKSQWNDQSFFANGNTDLINLDAFQEQMRKEAASKAGEANLLAFLGIPQEQVAAQGKAVGKTLRAGISQAMTASTMEGEAGSLTNFSTDFANIINNQLEGSEAFAATGSAILTKIVESWSDLRTIAVDLVKPIADAINAQLDTSAAIEVLKNTGARMVKIVFAGFDEEALGLNWVGSVASAANNTTAAEIPGNANGTSNWRGGLSWVGERGPELVNLPRGSQVFNNSDSLDMTRSSAGGGMTIIVNVADTSLTDTRKLARELAYEVATEIRRKGF